MSKEFAQKEIVFEHYMIEKVIGHGGMNSTIYLIQDLNLQENDTRRQKVLKVVEKNDKTSNDEWRKFGDEVATMCRLWDVKVNIQGVARIFKFFTEENKYYIIMEYASGQTLRQMITQNGALTVVESLYIMKSLLYTIYKIHSAFEQKLIHRDLKPENIIISNDRLTIKIIDFGVSSSLHTKKNRSNAIIKGESLENEIYGTFSYLTPQILEAKGMAKDKRKELIDAIGIQFDLYALGVIFYEMLMGAKPFISEENETTQALYNSKKYDIKPISTIKTFIPAAVENIIIRLMASKKYDSKSNPVEQKQETDDSKPQAHKNNDNKILMYTSAKEAYDDVTTIISYYEDNKEVPNEPLLLDPDEREYQKNLSKIFAVKKIRSKIYEQWWFGAMIILLCLGLFIAVFIYHR